MRPTTTRRSVGAPGVARRTVLRSLGCCGLATMVAWPLAGCGLRLDVAPPTAPAPTRRRAPDEALLIAVVRDLTEIVAAERALVSSGAGGRVIPTLLRLHDAQRRTLIGRLTNDGVPTTEITAVGGARPSGMPSTSVARAGARPGGAPGAAPGAVSDAVPGAASGAGARPGSPPRTTSQLADRLDSFTDADWAAVAGATAATRGVLTAAYAARLAGAVRLGRPVPVTVTPSPVREALLARTRPLVYAFEVVAAQTSAGQRRRALATLARLRLLEKELAAKSTSTSLPAGWALPFPVTTPDAAQRLATHVLSAAVSATVAVTGPSPTARTLEDAARWSARVQAAGVDWGLALTAFPGART